MKAINGTTVRNTKTLLSSKNQFKYTIQIKKEYYNFQGSFEAEKKYILKTYFENNEKE